MLMAVQQNDYVEKLFWMESKESVEIPPKIFAVAPRIAPFFSQLPDD